MESIEDLVGQTVLIKLESSEGLEFSGIPDGTPFFCKVEAVDRIGVWVENRKFVTVDIADSKGKFIPKEKQKPKRHVVNMLLPWRNIQIVVMFRGKSAERIVKKLIEGDSKGAGKIGFLR